MADPYVAEIRIFPFSFAPRGWAFCNGQLLPISQNAALFSLLGTTYGGDGETTFALPNLQGQVPMHPGQGTGLGQFTRYTLGESGGSATATLLESQMALHNHVLMASQTDGISHQPANQLFAAGVGGVAAYAEPSTFVQMNQEATTPAGGGQPHNNMQPYLTFNFCIAVQGIYPLRD
jgi:microcystin-dependent protein